MSVEGGSGPDCLLPERVLQVLTRLPLPRSLPLLVLTCNCHSPSHGPPLWNPRQVCLRRMDVADTNKRSGEVKYVSSISSQLTSCYLGQRFKKGGSMGCRPAEPGGPAWDEWGGGAGQVGGTGKHKEVQSLWPLSQLGCGWCWRQMHMALNWFRGTE